MKLYTVYCVRNIASGKSYVGITGNDLTKRWKSHVWQSSHGSCYKFHQAIRKHGVASFEVFVLQECKDEHEVRVAEVAWIEKLDTYSHGYNSTLGGDGVLGCQWSQSSRDKASRSKAGIPLTDEHKQSIGKSLRERFHRVPRPKRIVSEETKQKLRAAAKMAWETEEKRARILAGQNSYHERNMEAVCVTT